MTVAKDIPTQGNFNNFLKALVIRLQEIIGDELGTYDIYDSNNNIRSVIPAIFVEPPPFANKRRNMTPDSGIECIIHRTPKQSQFQMIGNGHQVFHDYCFTLTQYNTSQSLALVTTKILTNPSFFIVEQPRHMPFMQEEDMYIYEKADFMIRAYQYINQT